MGVELKLQESLQQSTTDFQERVKKIMEDMKTKTGAYIKDVQVEMEQFSADLKAYSALEFERINNMEEDISGGDAEALSDNMVTLMSDSDVLTQHLEASKENVDSKIGDQESNIVRELMRDWKNTETRIIDDQHQRNRTIVQEVIKTCEKFRREISK